MVEVHSLAIAVTNEFDPEYQIHRQPARRWRLTLEQIHRLVDEAADLHGRLLILTGGEPFLLGDTLQAAIKYAALRIPTVRVVTTCYWAKTPHKALEMAGLLYQNGLSELDLRFSDWNQEPQWQQWVKWVTLAAEQVGITVLAHHLMVRREKKLSFVHIKEYPSQTGEAYRQALESGELQDHLLGMSLVPYDPQSNNEPTPDELLFVQPMAPSPCPWILKAITAHPDGKLTACSGSACAVADDLNLGDWFTTPLKDLLAAADHNPLLQWIRLSGPKALRDFVRQHSSPAPFRDSYANLCHLL